MDYWSEMLSASTLCYSPCFLESPLYAGADLALSITIHAAMFSLWSATLTGGRWVSEGWCMLSPPDPMPSGRASSWRLSSGFKTTCICTHTHTPELVFFVSLVYFGLTSTLTYIIVSFQLLSLCLFLGNRFLVPRVWVVSPFVLFVECTHLLVRLCGEVGPLSPLSCVSLSTHVPFSAVPASYMWVEPETPPSRGGHCRPGLFSLLMASAVGCFFGNLIFSSMSVMQIKPFRIVLSRLWFMESESLP